MEHKKEQTTETESMETRVLDRIRTEDLSVHSKAYFYGRVAFAVVVSCVVFCVSAFLFDYILYILAASGRSLLLGFGPHGLLFFFEAFPWWVLVGDVVFIFLLERMLRQFKFAYRSPTLYIVGGLIVVSALAGFGLSYVTDFGRYIPADGNMQAAPVGALFNNARRAPLPDRGVCRCTITAVGDGQLSVIDTENADLALTVILPANDPHVHSDGLQIGDKVFIAGTLQGATLYAFGLHLVAPTEPAFPQPY